MPLSRALIIAVTCVLGGLLPGVPEAAERAAGRCIPVVTGGGMKECIAPGSGRDRWFRDCDGCPEMVVVPAGRFQMGPSDSSRRVRIAKPFAVGRFAVTFAEWDACVADGGCGGYRPADQGWGRGSLPVINVSWHDAQAFAAWLTRKTGQTYRLLSEQEREYVARAGTRSAYWWGDSIDLDQANYDLPIRSRRLSGDVGAPTPKGRWRTVPVQHFAPNPWGLYNVHGNVWEWTSDCFRRPEAAEDPAAQCAERIAKGGSWNDWADFARSDARIGFLASSRNAMQSFRTMREVP